MDQGSASFPPVAAKRDAAANQLEAIAAGLEAAGHSDAAQFALQAAAALDLADESLQRSWGGPMNGQEGRAEAFLALAAAVEAGAIVETGTYRGTTTEWIASHLAAPIYTCEADPRLYYQARQKLSAFSHVMCALQDSRVFLKELAPTLPRDRAILFYLDAHWNEDLPLRAELDIILRDHDRAVIMIDDFAVPFDEGYAWDDYGPGKRLTLEILEGTAARDARIFFPTLPSQAETGARRGCCVIVQSPELTAKLATLPHFRAADWREWRLVELTQQVERERRAALDAQQRALDAYAQVETLRNSLAETARASAQMQDGFALTKAELEKALSDAARTMLEMEAGFAATKAEFERALDQLASSAADLREQYEREAKARRDLAEQLRVMKAYCGIIE